MMTALGCLSRPIVALDPLFDAEQAAGDALADTVPTTLAGVAAALAYVSTLHAERNYPTLDEDGCYALIRLVDAGMRRVMETMA